MEQLWKQNHQEHQQEHLTTSSDKNDKNSNIKPTLSTKASSKQHSKGKQQQRRVDGSVNASPAIRSSGVPAILEERMGVWDVDSIGGESITVALADTFMLFVSQSCRSAYLACAFVGLGKNSKIFFRVSYTTTKSSV
jgi:hypothetical protein